MRECECGAALINGRCAPCDVLKTPHLDAFMLRAKLRRRIKGKATERGEWLSAKEAGDGAVRALRYSTSRETGRFAEQRSR